MKNTIQTSLQLSTLIVCAALVGGCCNKRAEAGAGYSATYAAPTTTYGTTTTAPEAAPRAEPARAEALTAEQVVIPLHQEKLNVGKMQVDAGTVRLKKQVVTETVNQPLELRHETLTINRQPAGAGAVTTNGQAQAFQEQEFTIQLHREQPMVQKQVVQSGSIVAQRQARTEQTNIQSTIRREDIAVDKGTADVLVSEAAGVTTTEAMGGATTPGAESRGAATSGTIKDLSTLTETTDAGSLSGRSVQLYNVRVQEVVNPHLVTIGVEGEASPVHAYLPQPIENLKAGDRLNLSGTVKAPAAAATMGADISQRLSSQPFFVEAQSAQLSTQ